MNINGSNRVMLMEPPFYRLYHDQQSFVKYPLPLGYLSGAVCKNTNWTVQTYNADFNPNRKKFSPENDYITGDGFKRYLASLKDYDLPIWNEVKQAIKDFNPSVLGITLKTQNFLSATICAKKAKEVNPDIVIVIGGAHATMNGDNVFEHKEIDVSCIGEGEITIVELLKALESGKPLNTVNGIMFRDENNKIARTPPRTYIENLDLLAHPFTYAKKTLKDFDRYPKEAFSNVFASRGCPYACTFCESKAMWTRKVRYRSPQNIVEELKQLRDFGIKRVSFEDDTFGVSKKNIKAINNLMHKELPDMTYMCETVVQLAKDEQVVKDMKHGGCTGVFVGIESGNNEILKKIKKTQTRDECIEAVKNLKKHGIEASVFIMIGFPTETEETIKETMDFIPIMSPDHVVFSIFTPYPGSELFNECKEMGIIEKDTDFDISIYNHQSPMNCFTKYISKERFYELRKEAVKFVDNYNRKKKVVRAFKILKHSGPKVLFQKTFSYFYSYFLRLIKV